MKGQDICPQMTLGPWTFSENVLGRKKDMSQTCPRSSKVSSNFPEDGTGHCQLKALFYLAIGIWLGTLARGPFFSSFLALSNITMCYGLCSIKKANNLVTSPRYSIQCMTLLEILFKNLKKVGKCQLISPIKMSDTYCRKRLGCAAILQ